MTRINWDEVYTLNRLDEIIAYSIITLHEAYNAPDNYDLDVETKKDISQWIRWAIGYDEQGRAFFRYAANLYMVDRNPLGSGSILEMLEAPTKYLVNHQSLYLDNKRLGDTSLEIDTRTQIPVECDTLERLLYWVVVVANYWGQILKYLAFKGDAVAIPANPLDSWTELPPGVEIEGEENSGQTIDSQFDEYNGVVDDPSIPSFLAGLLEKSAQGSGSIEQVINLPSADSGNYRENLTTCEEQDPKIINYSQQSLDALLPQK